ncbi:LOW QUALITY PROTEIN: olfactory receptor 5G29-like [Arvicanthis niloticus]|uniref:LOW QUALITY PROTEIN: olfactory receptor 5G29-like n=1 Tax=Arvicanthis niloticus TaxID=61156 RepID=UPI001485DC19|nr:LOW QUALITY PROTEIN: olfactory receptor 998-like [Arvicanthis niloticus]
MEEKNETTVLEFLFLGLTDYFHQKIILFIMFFFVYLVTLAGNVGMINLIWVDARLHTPMYFFLSQLAFVDVCSSSCVAPKMLCDIFAEKKAISFMGCAAQMWFFGLFVTTDCFLLAAMAYDRYTAICKPLLYSLIMSKRVCVQFVIGPYLLAAINITTHTTLTFCLPFCGSNTINHFFCDVSPLLSLACADTWINKVVFFVLAGVIGIPSGLIIIVSYVCILVVILEIKTADGRQKAFSTCSSHLAAVSILYGTLFFIYVRPNASSSPDINKVISLFYTVVIPMLNPFIYSLRNKEVKNALKRILERKYFLAGA